MDFRSVSWWAPPHPLLGVKGYRRRWRAITSSCQRLENATNRAENPHAHVRKSYQIHVSNMRTSMSGTFVKCPSNESNVAPDSTTHYDGGDENLLDILQHPCYRLVAIQERDYCV